MMPLQQFEEFIRNGTVSKRSSNPARARSLQKDALKRKQFIEDVNVSVGVKNENANYTVGTK